MKCSYNITNLYQHYFIYTYILHEQIREKAIVKPNFTIATTIEGIICTNIMQIGAGNVNPMKMTKCISEFGINIFKLV